MREEPNEVKKLREQVDALTQELAKTSADSCLFAYARPVAIEITKLEERCALLERKQEQTEREFAKLRELASTKTLEQVSDGQGVTLRDVSELVRAIKGGG